MRAGLRRDRAMTRQSSTGGPSALEGGWGRDPAGFVYFNNDGNGCALRDASVFARALDRRGVRVASQPVVPDDVLVDRASSRPTPRAARPERPGRPPATVRGPFPTLGFAVARTIVPRRMRPTQAAASRLARAAAIGTPAACS